MMRKYLWVGLLTGLLTGCESIPKAGTPEAIVYAEKKRTELLTEAVARGVDTIPDWCAKPPVQDSALYACGVGESQDLNMARTRAELEAKRQLADRLAGTVSSQIKRFQESVGDSLNEQVVEQITVVTKSLATDVELAGYRTSESELVANGPKYLSYVLLEYPIGEVNRVVVEKVKQNQVLNTRLSAAEAFKELEAEIQAARQAKQDNVVTPVQTTVVERPGN